MTVILVIIYSNSFSGLNVYLLTGELFSTGKIVGVK